MVHWSDQNGGCGLSGSPFNDAFRSTTMLSDTSTPPDTVLPVAARSFVESFHKTYLRINLYEKETSISALIIGLTFARVLRF